MDFLIILAIFIGLLIIALINWYLAGCFYDVACEKGFTERRYFWVPFWFGLIGYLLVIALPDRKKDTAARPPMKPMSFSKAEGGTWTCPDCGGTIPFDVIRCKCGYEKPKQ